MNQINRAYLERHTIALPGMPSIISRHDGNGSGSCVVDDNINTTHTTANATITNDSRDGENEIAQHNQQAPFVPSRDDWFRRTLAAVWQESCKLWDLTMPTVVVKVGMFVPQTAITAVVGKRFGVDHLAGFTFGNLVATISMLSLLMGLLSATDTLAPQAFGARNYRQVGILAIRGTVICVVGVIPINILAAFGIENALLVLGQPPLAAHYAKQYYQTFVFGCPFTILYFVGWKFLAAQSTMKPLLVSTLVSVTTVFPLGLWLCTEYFGFVGSALVMVIYQASLAIFLFASIYVFQSHHPDTWEGFWPVWREALLDWEATRAFLKLGVGGVLTLTDWWFLELLNLVVGLFGVVPLSIHAIASQAYFSVYMIPSGVALALAVRVSSEIVQDYRKAQRLLLVCSVIIIGLSGVMALALNRWRYDVITLFTSNPAVIQVCLCLYMGMGVRALVGCVDITAKRVVPNVGECQNRRICPSRVAFPVTFLCLSLTQTHTSSPLPPNYFPSAH